MEFDFANGQSVTARNSEDRSSSSLFSQETPSSKLLDKFDDLDLELREANEEISLLTAKAILLEADKESLRAELGRRLGFPVEEPSRKLIYTPQSESEEYIEDDINNRESDENWGDDESQFTPIQQTVIDYIINNKKSTPREIINGTELNPNTVYSTLERLKELNVIHKSNAYKGKRTIVVYSMGK